MHPVRPPRVGATLPQRNFRDGDRRPRILFLCTGNSCRSQMAEGLLRSLAGRRYRAASAGTDPQGVNPGAVTAMAEIGIDISDHRSRHVDDFLGTGVDTVITVCSRAATNCPVFPERTRMERWSFDDPAEARGSATERATTFRRVRDEIADAIRGWLAERTAQG